MTMPPTGWFLSVSPDVNDGQPTSAARWYWPGDTLVEVYDFGSRSWIPVDAFASINIDTKWQDSTEDEVNAWIASPG